jgi:hypothetical protein
MSRGYLVRTLERDLRRVRDNFLAEFIEGPVPASTGADKAANHRRGCQVRLIATPVSASSDLALA